MIELLQLLQWKLTKQRLIRRKLLKKKWILQCLFYNSITKSPIPYLKSVLSMLNLIKNIWSRGRTNIDQKCFQLLGSWILYYQCKIILRLNMHRKNFIVQDQTLTRRWWNFNLIMKKSKLSVLMGFLFFYHFDVIYNWIW